MTSAKPRPPLIPGETRAYPVLPLRDIVVFPHMIVPLFVGREKSIKALEEVMRSDTFILLATQKNASDDDPATGAIYEMGTLASVLQLLKLPDGTVKVLVEGAARAPGHPLHRSRRILRSRRRGGDRHPRRAGRGRSARALGHQRVRELREAQQEGVARGRQRGPADRGLCQARRHGGLASGGQDPREADHPGDRDRHRAAGEGARPDGERNLGPAGREAHPHARQAADGEDPARVLPQRADEGDPEGARRRRGQGRARRDRGQDQEDQALEGGPRKGRPTSSRSCARCRRCRPRPPSCATTWIGCCRSHGTRSPRSRRTSRRRRKSSMPITSAWRRSRSASSSTWRCSSAPTS